jgi:hypothetical protein
MLHCINGPMHDSVGWMHDTVGWMHDTMGSVWSCSALSLVYMLHCRCGFLCGSTSLETYKPQRKCWSFPLEADEGFDWGDGARKIVCATGLGFNWVFESLAHKWCTPQMFAKVKGIDISHFVGD